MMVFMQEGIELTLHEFLVPEKKSWDFGFGLTV